MKNVWKNPLIDITVFVTVIVAVSYIMFILIGSTPVWADTKTGDVYEIPEDYKDRNYVIQIRQSGTGSKYVQDEKGNYTILDKGNYISDYTFDFTVYYPSNLLCSLYSNTYNSKDSLGLQFCYVDDDSYLFGFMFNTELKFDTNNVAKIEVYYYKDNDYNGEKVYTYFYIKKNNCSCHTVYTLDEHGVIEEDYVLQLSTLYGGFCASSCVLYSVNYPFYNYPMNSSGYNYIVYSGVYGKSYVVQQFYSRTSSIKEPISAIKCIEKRIATNVSGVFPEPIMLQAKKISDSTLHCFYEYPTQGRTPNFNYVYPKIYVKVDGKDWVEYKEEDKSAKGFEHIFNFHVDNENQSIWGALSLRTLYIRMGYTYSEITAKDFVSPKIQGIIWGVQYGYALTQNILDESSIRKSKIVFSRYVFEDNIVDTPDVGIGDLGDLPNISGSTSNIEVGTGSNRPSGGSTNRPGMGQNVPDKDSTSFIDLIISGKLNFSSIGDALSSLFSMVSGFASAVGSILGAVFGNTFGMIALCAVGSAIVLRVLGR